MRMRQEMEQWPAVVVKRAFGMTLIYRGKVVFAALPGTRALYEEDAVLIKFARETPALGKTNCRGEALRGRHHAAGAWRKEARRRTEMADLPAPRGARCP